MLIPRLSTLIKMKRTIHSNAPGSRRPDEGTPWYGPPARHLAQVVPTEKALDVMTTISPCMICNVYIYIWYIYIYHMICIYIYIFYWYIDIWTYWYIDILIWILVCVYICQCMCVYIYICTYSIVIFTYWSLLGNLQFNHGFDAWIIYLINRHIFTDYPW